MGGLESGNGVGPSRKAGAELIVMRSAGEEVSAGDKAEA